MTSHISPIHPFLHLSLLNRYQRFVRECRIPCDITADTQRVATHPCLDSVLAGDCSSTVYAFVHLYECIFKLECSCMHFYMHVWM